MLRRLLVVGVLASLIAVPAIAEPQDDGSDREVQVHTFHFGWSGGVLGLTVIDMTEELRAYFRAPSDSGVLVSAVEPGSDADRAGVRVGDVIIEVDAQPIAEAGDLMDPVGAHVGESVLIKVVRDGAPTMLTAEVTTAPPAGFDFMTPLGEGSFQWDGIAGLEEYLQRLESHLHHFPVGEFRWSAPGFPSFEGAADLEQQVQALEERMRALEQRLETYSPQ